MTIHEIGERAFVVQLAEGFLGADDSCDATLDDALRFFSRTAARVRANELGGIVRGVRD